MSCSNAVMLLTIHACITAQRGESISGRFLPYPKVEWAGRSPACYSSFVKQNFSAVYVEKGHGCHKLQQMRKLWPKPSVSEREKKGKSFFL